MNIPGRLLTASSAAILALAVAAPSSADTVVCLVEPSPDDTSLPRLDLLPPTAANTDQEQVWDGFLEGANSWMPWATGVQVQNIGDSSATVTIEYTPAASGKPLAFDPNTPTISASGARIFTGGMMHIDPGQLPGDPEGNRVHGIRAAWYLAQSAINLSPDNMPFVLPDVDQVRRIANATAACGQLPGGLANADQLVADLQATFDSANIGNSDDPTPTVCPFFQDVTFWDATTGLQIQNLDSGNDIEVEIHISKNNGPGCTPPTDAVIEARGSQTFRLIDRRRVDFFTDPNYHLYERRGYSPEQYRLLKAGEEVRYQLVDRNTGDAWASRNLPLTQNFRRPVPGIMQTASPARTGVFFTNRRFVIPRRIIDIDPEDTPATLRFTGPFIDAIRAGQRAFDVDTPGQQIEFRAPHLRSNRSLSSPGPDGLLALIRAAHKAAQDDYRMQSDAGANAQELHDTFKRGFESGNGQRDIFTLNANEPGNPFFDVDVDEHFFIGEVPDSSADPGGYIDGFEDGNNFEGINQPGAVFSPLSGARQPAAAAGINLPVAFMDIDRPDRITTELRNVGSGAYLGHVDFLGASFRAIGFGTLADMNGNGAMEAMVLATRKSDGAIIVQVRDTDTGAKLSNVYFLGPDFVPWRLLRLFDQNGNGADEILVLAYRKSDSAMIYQMRDSMTGELLQNRYILGSGFVPVAFRAIPDTDSDGILQIGVLAIRVSDSRFVVQVINATGTANKHNVWFLGPQYIPYDLSILPDSNGDGRPEIIVLALRHADGRFLAQVRNASGVPAPRNYWFLNPDYVPLQVLGIPDTDGDGIPEIAVLAWRYEQDGQFLVQIRNSSGPANPTNVWFMEAGFTPLNLFAFVDGNVMGGLRLGVVARRFVDDRLRVQVRIPRGAPLPYDVWLKPEN